VDRADLRRGRARVAALDNWDLAWSGFDSVLAALFMLTAYAAWNHRHWLPAAAAATGALLIADAWFDVTLASRTNDFKAALIEALAAELPLAAMCFWIGFTTEARAEPTPP
jgi:hypothetical protein